jgi:hypothetical protein
MALMVKLCAVWVSATIFGLVSGQQDLFGQRFSVPSDPFRPQLGQSIRVTAENLRDIDWTQVDRRVEDCKLSLSVRTLISGVHGPGQGTNFGGSEPVEKHQQTNFCHKS